MKHDSHNQNVMSSIIVNIFSIKPVIQSFLSVIYVSCGDASLNTSIPIVILALSYCVNVCIVYLYIYFNVMCLYCTFDIILVHFFYTM